MNKRYGLFVFIIVSILFIPRVEATVNISDEDYEKLRNVFSEERIATMSEDEVERYLSYDLENAVSEIKYYDVYQNTNGYTYVELSEEEALYGIMPQSTSHSTSRKIVQVSRASAGTNKYYVSLTTKWLVTPNVKSFDVSALRFTNASVVTNSQDGIQTYWTSSTQTYQNVQYSPTGTNIVKKTNGFGISMNLVDAASFFELYIDCIVNVTGNNAKAYGSYQHAVEYVSLAQSQNYTLSHNGYGNVINFAESVEDYYDGMGGVDISLPYN